MHRASRRPSPVGVPAGRSSAARLIVGRLVLLLSVLLLSVGLFVATASPRAVARDETREARLAEAGRARLEIIVSPRASAATRQVAAELAGYLGRIAGASFEVKEGDGSAGIVLGTIEKFPDPALAPGLALRDTCDGKEAYTIRTESGRVRLIGASERGASHAAFRLLEHLGCRWFFPTPEWEVVPSIPDLSITLDATERPKLLSRRIWYGYGPFDERSRTDYESWRRRNRQAASLTISAGHAWQSIILDNRPEFEQHPEYLALVDGKRRGEQLCVSNPEVRRLAARWALEQLRKHPEADMVSMECSDGDGQCECGPCRALGSVSDRVFGLANEVARAVAAESPGKWVGLLAYNQHCEPPAFDLEPNVYVQATAGFIRGRYTFDELVELWPKRCRNMGFYEYLSVWLWDFDLLPGGRGANTKYLREQLPRYASAHGTSLDCESGNNWGLHGRGYYLASRLMWDPKADADAILADFHEKAFGPAAGAMRRYYDRLDPGNEPLMGEPLLALALRDLEEASRLAGGCTDVLARLDQLKQYQHYVRLRWEHDHATDKDRKRELALAALMHAYRTRRTYMNHWHAMQQAWLEPAAREFDRPAWSVRDPSPNKPWKVETPYTPEETERLFRADHRRFRPQPVEEVAFSDDLVPASFRTPKPAESRQTFLGRRRYALYSREGEPVAMTITTGVIAHYRDRPAARYTVADAASRTIAEGRLPQDGAEHRLEVAVPRAGRYVLDYDDQAVGWTIRAEAGRPCTLLLDRNPPGSHLGHMPRMSFYVPRGTPTVDLFAGHRVMLYTPDGRLVYEQKEGGVNARVAVPEGADGAVWSCDPHDGRVWFFNVPAVLAASPDALLVPLEVAERDGLLTPERP
jgi:hypothetical protein